MPAFFTRTPFVGRDAELQRLRQAFDAAAAGEGTLALVVGEPGIGKTSLCGQLAAYAVERSGQALTGHCYEEGSLSLPYLPFVEAMRAYVLDRGREPLRRELGVGAADVARIVPELREILNVEPGPATDPETDRYRLLQAVTAFLRTIAESRPLLLVLEDLHDADRGTLDLLLHLARHLPLGGEAKDSPPHGTARLLLVGTYRDVEVDRAHPLSGALADLRRAAPVGRVRLGGLTVGEAQQVVSAVAGEDVPHGVAEAVHRQSEGNPLFVQEVARYLVEEGLAAGTHGRAVGGLPLTLHIPEGLRDVIGKRLSRLAPECNRLLAVAAVIGRDFGLDTLAAVAGADEDTLVEALDEAVRTGVVEERERRGGVQYRFNHALIRQALYEELRAPRRIRLHQQVARALERRYASRLAEHAAELADHFAHSSDPADLAKAVEYGELAARRAAEVFASGEAARLLAQALEVQDVLDPDDKAKRCDLLIALGDALIDADEPRRMLDTVAEEALALADALNDRAHASRVCKSALWGLMYWAAGPAFETPEGAMWAERTGHYALPETVDRAVADTFLGWVMCYSGRRGEGVGFLNRGLDLARRLDEPDVLWLAVFGWMDCVSSPRYDEARLRLAEEFAAAPRDGVRPRTLVWVLVFSGAILLARGARDRAESVWRECQELARRSGRTVPVCHAVSLDAQLATLEGRLDEAVTGGRRILEIAREIPDFAHIVATIASARARLYRGEAHEGLELIVRASSWRLLFLPHLGRDDEVRAVLDQWMVTRAGSEAEDDATVEWMDIVCLEAAILVGHREAAGLLLRRFADTPVRMGGFLQSLVARQVGAAAALLGRPDEARIFYEKALDDAASLRFRPEIALTRLHIAELLLAHYAAERDAARDHLEFAIAEFREMGMEPSLERALRVRERAALAVPDALGDLGVAPALTGGFPSERRLLTVLFTDIVDSTPWAAALGDRRWVELKARYHALVRQELARFGGHEVDTAGDGFFVTFDTPARAVRCACAVRDAVRDLGIAIRAGLHFGEVEVQDTGVSGIAVHTGARVMALARPGEVLVSRTVKDLVAGSGIRFADRGLHALKGVPGEWALFAVEAIDIT
jgi:class 3 adenylate cyclase